MTPTFNKALLQGKQVEQLVLDRVRENDPFAIIIDGKFPQFDIYSPSTNTRIEVKSDLKSQETKNFLIEVHHYGKASALLISEADIWVFYDGQYLIWVKPSKIKNVILEKGLPQRTLVGDGDTVPKRCYLVPTKDIIEIAERMESIHEN